jgi:threonine aldolase
VEGDRRAFLDALARRGVLMVEYPHEQVRAVTHHDVATADIDVVIRAAREALDETGPARPAETSAEPVGATA